MKPHEPDTEGTLSEEKDTEYSPAPTHALNGRHTDTQSVEETEGREIPSDLDYMLLGKYRLIKLLGKGGMGSIYLAEHTELRKLVAIKVISEKLLDKPQFVSLFKREARSAAKLQHPNIARVFDYGQEKGKCLYVMDYVQGNSLAEIIDSSGPLPSRRALSIFKQIVEALDHAHKAGIIHRDIKPSNILIDQASSVKLLDFGLARSVYGEDGLTAAGQSPGGTPSYMSPEQRKGRPTDARTDIYSAGVTLFEMLTGVLPRDVNSPRERLLSALGKNRNPFQKGTPSQIADMTMKCLDDPNKRYASAEEVLAEIGKIERRGQQQRWFLRGAAGAVAAAGLAVVGVLTFSPRGSQANDAVKCLEENNFPKAAKLFEQLSKSEPSDVNNRYGLGLSYLGMGKVDEAELQFKKIAQSFGDRTTADEEGLARVAYARSEEDKALELYQKALKSGRDHTFIHVTIGDLLLLRNQLDEAIEKYKKALGREPIFRFQLASAYAGLGKAYARKGDLDGGLSSLRKAESVRPANAEIASDLWNVLMRKGEYTEALKTIESAATKNPNDSLSLSLRADIARNAEAERQKRIAAAVNGLIEHAGHTATGPPSEEAWESKPTALVILDPKRAGTSPVREGEYEMLMFHLSRAVQMAGRVSVVERKVLEEILRELKMGTSDLANPQAALALGRILPAGLIAAATLRDEEQRLGLDIRLAETETTKLSIWLSETQDEGESVVRFAERIGALLIQKIRQTYPLKARIVRLNEDNAILNLGRKHGLRPGTEMEVIKREAEQIGEQTVYRDRKAGKLTVKEVNPDFSVARVVEGVGAVSADDRVIETVKMDAE